MLEVDGATDEGTIHDEVQFLHTERHLAKRTRVSVITERTAGDSFLNDAEQQNGWQCQAQTNLFIPTTLLGSNNDPNTVASKHYL